MQTPAELALRKKLQEQLDSSGWHAPMELPVQDNVTKQAGALADTEPNTPSAVMKPAPLGGGIDHVNPPPADPDETPSLSIRNPHEAELKKVLESVIKNTGHMGDQNKMLESYNMSQMGVPSRASHSGEIMSLLMRGGASAGEAAKVAEGVAPESAESRRDHMLKMLQSNLAGTNALTDNQVALVKALEVNPELKTMLGLERLNVSKDRLANTVHSQTIEDFNKRAGPILDSNLRLKRAMVSLNKDQVLSPDLHDAMQAARSAQVGSSGSTGEERMQTYLGNLPLEARTKIAAWEGGLAPVNKTDPVYLHFKDFIKSLMDENSAAVAAIGVATKKRSGTFYKKHPDLSQDYDNLISGKSDYVKNPSSDKVSGVNKSGMTPEQRTARIKELEAKGVK